MKSAPELAPFEGIVSLSEFKQILHILHIQRFACKCFDGLFDYTAELVVGLFFCLYMFEITDVL